MSEIILNKDSLAKKRFALVFRTLQTPRHIILFIDLCIVTLGTLLTTFFKIIILHRFSYNAWDGFFPKLSLILATYLLSFVIFKTYHGIIRYSGTRDAIKLLFSVTMATTILIINSCIVKYITGYPIFIYNTIIALQGLIILAGMCVLRLTVKYIYNKSNIGDIKERTRVIILGTATNSVVLARKLKEEENGCYLPVAFLNMKKGRFTDSEIDGIPVIKYTPENTDNIFRKYNATTMIFEPSQINLLRNGEIAPFLNVDIKVLQMNDNSIQHRKGDKNIQISSNVQDLQIEDLLGRDVIKSDNNKIKEYIKDKIVMVTGAAGSIGSEIVRQLSKHDAKQIILFDCAETPMHNIYIELNDTNTAKNIIPYIGDVRNIDSLTDAFEMYHPQIIFHAAAYKHVPMMEMHPSEAIKTNVGGSKNVADLSMKYNAERFVMISTDKAVNPTNVMGASKRLAEIYVQSLALSLKKNESKNHTRFMTTRFGNVLGSNGSVVPLFKNQISSGGPITITDKRIVRYFMTIPEACELVLEAGRMGNGGEIFVFDMGKPVKIYDMAKQMIMLSGLKPYIDIDIVETGLRPGEKLYEELLNDKEATEATHNDKITIGKVREYDYNDVASQIDDLIKTAKHNDSKAIVTMMKTLVPEYISKNSVFEKLDKHHDTKKTKPNA
ncbi:MAG: nucleoside-diphosphate sugar epimerase/dehydratase [Bacteroidales bacterium]